ncbi:MAG: amidohydrolase [Deltaproteobacteria bacterium]|nr:amidohydrolase [Deltaproteobacteria bacterium]
MALALMGARIMTASDGVIEEGTLVIEGRTIEAVGADVRPPKDAEVQDLRGKVLIPGMIDAHTHLGLCQDGVGASQSDEDEVGDPVVPHLRALDAINPEDIAFQDALKGGVTTVGVMPGSFNVICGQPAAVKVVGRTLEEMLVRAPVGMKIAFGERPKQVYGGMKKSPMTRMGIAAILREGLARAQLYAADGNGRRDLRQEAMVPVVRKQIPLRAHAHRADDIMTAIRIAREFDLDLIIEHGTDGYKVAGELAEAGVGVVHGPWLKTRGNLEQSGRSPDSPRILVENGVLTAFSTDHPVIPIQNHRMQGMTAVEHGVSPEEALKALTLNSARLMGIDERVGSLEKGKDADVVVLSGPPFDAATQVEGVIVNGTVGWTSEPARI